MIPTRKQDPDVSNVVGFCSTLSERHGGELIPYRPQDRNQLGRPGAALILCPAEQTLENARPNRDQCNDVYDEILHGDMRCSNVHERDAIFCDEMSSLRVCIAARQTGRPYAGVCQNVPGEE
jgi:hypothetical protein